MTESLSEREAYAAMYAFLDVLHHRGFEHVGGLLGSMSLLPDGDPADPALWDDWQEAVRRARAGEVDLDLGLS